MCVFVNMHDGNIIQMFDILENYEENLSVCGEPNETPHMAQ